jgi:hypothetical protein
LKPECGQERILSARDELFPRHGLEILRQGVDRRAAKIAQEPALVLEENSRDKNFLFGSARSQARFHVDFPSHHRKRA